MHERKLFLALKEDIHESGEGTPAKRLSWKRLLEHDDDAVLFLAIEQGTIIRRKHQKLIAFQMDVRAVRDRENKALKDLKADLLLFCPGCDGSAGTQHRAPARVD